MKYGIFLMAVTMLPFAVYAQEWPISYADPAWQTFKVQDVEDLLNAGADVNQRLFDGWTPLMCAAWGSPSPEVIRALVEAGADLEARDDNGMTALMRAANNSENPAVVEALLAAGADRTATDGTNGRTLAQHAQYNPAMMDTPVYQKLLGRLRAEDYSFDFGAADLMQFSEVPPEVYEIPAIYPAGWSPDGKFAYLQDRFVEVSGDMSTIYTILDAATGAAVFQEQEYNVYWAGERYYYEETAGKFHTALEEQEVRIGKGIEFYPFPYVTEEERYSCEVETVPSEEGSPFHGVDSYDVIVYSELLGSKRIFRSENVSALSVWIAGYFLSPFEPRILVVVGEEQWEFDGTVVSFLFLGCDLDSGFEP
jgi:hypothetical protein